MTTCWIIQGKIHMHQETWFALPNFQNTLILTCLVGLQQLSWAKGTVTNLEANQYHRQINLHSVLCTLQKFYALNTNWCMMCNPHRVTFMKYIYFKNISRKISYFWDVLLRLITFCASNTHIQILWNANNAMLRWSRGPKQVFNPATCHTLVGSQWEQTIQSQSCQRAKIQ